jgi:type IV pilus assembly protein PilB
MHVTSEGLKEILSNSSSISVEELNANENEANRSGRSLSDVLISRGIVPEQVFIENTAAFLHVPIINLERITLDPAIVERIPESYAKSRSVVLFAYDDTSHEGSVAMTDPNDFETLMYLRQKLHASWLTVHLTTSRSIKFALKTYRKEISEEFNQIIQENIKASAGLHGMAGVGVEKLVEAVPIVRILDTILEQAANLGVSDIHFEPFRDKLIIRYRLDGILQEMLSLPKEIGPVLVARIKIVSNMQIDVHSAPQDGRFRFPLEDQFMDVRVSVIPTFHGEKAEMRLLKGSLRPLSLSELGLFREKLAILTDAVKKPHGLILVTGPTGSGKTTTLYAVLEILNTPKVNITTIEDPIEYDIPRVNQTQVNVKAGLTFAGGLRTLVRQNPDIIMIGEIRDGETADIAINAALTGHLLLSTLHTNDAPTAIPRLTDLGVKPFLLASTLNVVVAQRLVRRLCTSCITATTLTEESKKLLEEGLKRVDVTLEALPSTSYTSKGCSICGFTGYRGQIGLYEVLHVNDAIRALITENAATYLIRKEAQKAGMKTLFEDGLEKVSSGLTSLEEVIRVASE